jgi:hypothetical protein
VWNTAQRAPNSPASREVRTLADALFTLGSVRLDLAIIALRIGQRAVTEAESADLQAIARVMRDLENARGYLQRLHPNRLP